MDGGRVGRPTVPPGGRTPTANSAQARASRGSPSTPSCTTRATASTSAGFAGAATSRPAILRTSPPADSQAHLPASLAIPEPTAPSTPATAATDMGSSIPHSPFPTP